MSNETAELLDKTYNFSKQENAEIRLRFYEIALEDKNTSYKQEAANWVTRQGRMKYCRVMYRALNKVDSELARKTFIEHRNFYHPIAAAMIASVSEVRKGTASRPACSQFCCFCRIWVSHPDCLLHLFFLFCSNSQFDAHFYNIDLLTFDTDTLGSFFNIDD